MKPVIDCSLLFRLSYLDNSMKKIKIISLLISLNISCIHKTSVDNCVDSNGRQYCLMIDTLVLERYEWKTGNFYANKIVPVLERKCCVDASCDKGTFGYTYRSDSIFNSDVKKWEHCCSCQ